MNVQGRIAILLTLSLLMFAGAFRPAMGASSQDADNLTQAVGMVQTAARLVPAEMDECERNDPANAFRFRLARFIWQGENKEDVAIAQKMYEKAVKTDGRARIVDTLANEAIAAFPAMMRQMPNFCLLSANELSAGRKNVRAETPRAHAFLFEAFPPDAKATGEQERVDATIGCMKAYSNKGGADFDRGLAFCNCNTDVIYNDLTPEQRHGVLAYQARTSELMQLPWMEKVTPKMSKCVELLGQ